MTSESTKKSITFLLPCLNEEQTLGIVLDKIISLKNGALNDREVHMLVSDNGSADKSVEIAISRGARVVHCRERGYGAALQCGIQNAVTDYVIFADADNTYDFLESVKIIEEMDKGFDMVIGSRLKGTVKPGAMPFLHRWLGTPVLNFFINLLYANKKNRISDCNSGFRCFKKEAFMKWGVASSGMEFASEMLVKALIRDAKMSEVPITLHPHVSDRIPHLKTWRDGMRHLLQILIESPSFFQALGGTIFIFSWMLMLICGIIEEPVDVGSFSVLGIHTTVFASLGSFLGFSVWATGLFLSVWSVRKPPLYAALINLEEARLFWISFSIIFLSILFVSIVIFQWSQNDFQFLSLEKPVIVISAFITTGFLFLSNVITAHLIKRT